MNIRQRISRYFYPQVLIILACGILFSLLVFWFALQKITQNDFLQKDVQKENSVTEDRAQLLGFKAYLQRPTPVWDFFGILPAAASAGKNCTYSVQYLSEHPELWNTSNNISTSRFSFTKNDLLSLFQTQTQDLPLLLQQQFLAAAVNVINGADPSAVEASMKDASGWIDAHPPRIDLPEADRQTGLQLIQQLQNYNDGNIGPGLCPEQAKSVVLLTTTTGSSTPTSEPTAKSTVTLSQPTQSVMTVQQPRREVRNSNNSGSNSRGQANEAPSSTSSTTSSIPAILPTQANEPSQPPADSSATNPPPPSVDPGASNPSAPPTQVQPPPDNASNPPPSQAIEPDKGKRHPKDHQPPASTPAPEPPQGQGDPQPQPADTQPPPQPPDGGGGGNNGNGQGNDSPGNPGSGNGNGNHYGNGNGNGNNGNHGNGNNGNHGGGGHGKGH